VRALERIHRDKGVTIKVTCPPTLQFQGEQQDLEEMLGNLLDNACAWSKKSAFLTVKPLALPQRSARKTVVFLIEDDGPGLSPEQREKVGKRGQRLDESKPGSGLGLSIVADFATSYRGKLTLDTSPHGGLLVRVELPAV
jgi:signal transduction histidine kinase